LDLLAALSDEPQEVTDYLLALGFTVVAGIFSGLSPALKAADMEPVEALTY
jgi:ABC-type antimicrobial peptide transport system permease subunit